MTGSTPRRALLSCTNKEGLVPFAQALAGLGFELLSTGGTATTLRQAGLPVTDVSEYTGFPEMMEGRLKTLHPRVHGGLLGRPDRADDRASMEAHGILPFEVVVVNLYNFVETVAKPGVTPEEAIEQIDIGGPGMIRSAAKNHAHVAVVTRPDQYDRVAQGLRAGGLSPEFRRELAAAAFETTARYDRAIADYMTKITTKPADATADTNADAGDAAFPPALTLSFEKASGLRYGENPHQAAAYYREPNPPAGSLATAKTLHGKELSYNNLLDLDAALQIVREFDRPASVVIKHNNPCGCAVADTLVDAYLAADGGDPVSAFGSIVGFNRTLDVATAEQLCAPGHFIEAIVAPDYHPEAFRLLTTVPKWKNNVRLLECPGFMAARALEWDYRRITGGLLVQARDDRPEDESAWRVVTNRQPTDQERIDLAFAWKVCKYVKSNAILLAKDGAVVGVGAGQMSRVDSSNIACQKAGVRSQGAVAASDAFFPFRDNIGLFQMAGVKALIQPGGSKNDNDVIAACNEFDIAMIFTGQRHFRH